MARITKVSELTQLTSRFSSHVFLTTGTNILLSGLGVATGVMAARLLGPEGRGELAAIQLWAGVLGTLCLLGVPEALIYFSAKKPEWSRQYLLSAMFLALVAAIPFSIGGFLFMPVLLSMQTEAVITSARWYLLFLPLSALTGVPYQALRGIGDFRVWNMLRLLPSLGWFVLLLCSMMTGWNEAGGLALAYLFVLAVLAVPVIWIILRRVQGPFHLDVQSFKPMLKYGLPSVLGTVPTMLNLRLDQMLMAGFLPAQVLGQYVVAVAWSGAVAPLLNALGTVLFPRTASQKTREDQARGVGQGVRMAVLIALFLVLVVVLVTPLIIPLLFGDKFAPAIPAAWVLVCAAGILGVNFVLEEGLRGMGQPKLVLYSELVGLGVTLLCLLALLQPLGIMGAAIASLLGYSAVSAILLYWVTRFTQHPLLFFIRPTRGELQAIFSQVQTVWQKLRLR